MTNHCYFYFRVVKLLTVVETPLADHRYSVVANLMPCRWRIDGDDIPMAYPYVEFQRGLPIEIEPTSPES